MLYLTYSIVCTQCKIQMKASGHNVVRQIAPPLCLYSHQYLSVSITAVKPNLAIIAHMFKLGVMGVDPQVTGDSHF